MTAKAAAMKHHRKAAEIETRLRESLGLPGALGSSDDSASEDAPADD